MDETGLFFHALPDQGFVQKSRSYKGGKKSESRESPLLCLSLLQVTKRSQYSSGSQRIRGAYMHGFDKSCLPASYYSQSKVWMSGEILEDIYVH